MMVSKMVRMSKWSKTGKKMRKREKVIISPFCAIGFLPTVRLSCGGRLVIGLLNKVGL